MERIRKTPLKYIYMFSHLLEGTKLEGKGGTHRVVLLFLYDKEKNHSSSITYITNIYIYINIKQCRMKKH